MSSTHCVCARPKVYHRPERGFHRLTFRLFVFVSWLLSNSTNVRVLIHDVLKSKDPRRVYMALQALQKLQDPRSQRPIKEALLGAEHPAVRKLAMTVLHELSGPVQWQALSKELKKSPYLRLTG